MATLILKLAALPLARNATTTMVQDTSLPCTGSHEVIRKPSAEIAEPNPEVPAATSTQAHHQAEAGSPAEV